ncbi:MAG: phosphatase PAP2 family protein [Solobacterium sp.]|nr:phosphatase PAP2 family protein [Solobacterium sp.]
MDIWYLLWLQSLRQAAGPLVESIFVFISALAINPVTMLLPCVLYWAFDKKNGLRVLLTFLACNWVNQMIKVTVCAYRPWIRDARIQVAAGALKDATGYSFPSGHTTMAVSVYGTLGLLYQKRSSLLKWVCWIFVALTAFSRNFLGCHTPQDVIVALIEASLLVFLVGKAIDRFEQAGSPAKKVLWVVLAVNTAGLLFNYFKPYPMDYLNGQLLVDPVLMQKDSFEACGMIYGAVLGWYLERKYVGYTCEGLTAKTRGIRILIGILLGGGTYVLGKIALSSLELRLGAMLRYGLLFFVLMYVVPLVFTALERRNHVSEPLVLSRSEEKEPASVNN